MCLCSQIECGSDRRKMVLNRSKSHDNKSLLVLPDQTGVRSRNTDRKQTKKLIQSRVSCFWGRSEAVLALICVIIFNFSVTCSNASYNQYKVSWHIQYCFETIYANPVKFEAGSTLDWARSFEAEFAKYILLMFQQDNACCHEPNLFNKKDFMVKCVASSLNLNTSNFLMNSILKERGRDIANCKHS